MTREEFLAMLQRHRLRLLERCPGRYEDLQARLQRGESPNRLQPLLDSALRRPATPASSVEASHEAVRLLSPHLQPGEAQRLAVLQDRVLQHKTGPSTLRSEIYHFARRYSVQPLLESSWFDDVFERVETRRLAGIDLEVMF